MGDLTAQIFQVQEAEKKVREELEIRKEEKQKETKDLQNEVTWLRSEYDQLLKKVVIT